MNKVRVLSFLVGLLVFLNLSIMSYIILKPIKQETMHLPGRPYDMDEPIRRHFDFSDEQMSAFQKDKHRHLSRMHSIKAQQAQVTMQLYNSKLSNNHIHADSLLNELQVINDSIYDANIEHLQFIYGLCNDAQKDRMQSFIIEHVNNQKKPPLGRRK